MSLKRKAAAAFVSAACIGSGVYGVVANPTAAAAGTCIPTVSFDADPSSGNDAYQSFHVTFACTTPGHVIYEQIKAFCDDVGVGQVQWEYGAIVSAKGAKSQIHCPDGPAWLNPIYAMYSTDKVNWNQLATHTP